VKVAVVGLGYWGPKLLRNLVEITSPDRVVAVDSNLSRLEGVTSRYPSIGLQLSLDEALRDDEVEAVVISTPVETHASLSVAAIRAGRHVLVEKPLAGSVADARLLVEHAEHARVCLMVGHTFLFSPRVRYLADYLARGQLGRVQYASSSRLNLGMHRHDANVIWDLAPHDFSILFHLLGETPAAVQTTARCALRPDIPEVAFISLTFPSGAVASVTVSWLAPQKIRKTLIVGERQMIEYDDTRNDEPIKISDRGVALPDSSDFADNQLTYRFGDTIAPHVPHMEPLALQLAHFLDCVDERGRSQHLSDGWFGLRVVESLQAANDSWRMGGVPVEIDPAPTPANLSML
jgi:predicted dehydrogenase